MGGFSGRCRQPVIATLLLAGVVLAADAQSIADQSAAPPSGLNLSLDVNHLLQTGRPLLSLGAQPAPGANAPTARRRVHPSPSREDVTFSLDLEGYSPLQLDEHAVTRLQVRRVRDRERDWRKPMFFITVQSRF